MSTPEDRALYEECIAKLATRTVLRTTLAFLGDEAPNSFLTPDVLEPHEKRVLFIVKGDHTLSPQTLHAFDSKGKDIRDVQAFESLHPVDLATLAIFIAATRAQVLVLCAKFPTLETAKAAAEVA